MGLTGRSVAVPLQWLHAAGRVVADGPTAEVVTAGRLKETFGVDADITTDSTSGRPRVTARVRAVVEGER